jgi:hypothetical protein
LKKADAYSVKQDRLRSRCSLACLVLPVLTGTARLRDFLFLLANNTAEHLALVLDDGSIVG